MASKTMTTYYRRWSRVTIFLSLFFVLCDCQSISQISPKSSGLVDHSEQFVGTSTVTLENAIGSDSSSSLPKVRIERSALPILNEISSKSSFNDILDSEAKDPDAGRYLMYNIKPTTSFNELSENAEITKSRQRMAKELPVESSFLSQGGPRSAAISGPLIIKPTNAMQTAMTATSMTTNHARQNPNPDIQDIITGIVKLLNGNVNVHANTQLQRRPVASRINNRGPPRISEAQPLPLDYDGGPPPKPSSSAATVAAPYPFDRPDRPYMTGVPLPEQLVPALHPNLHRPGFVSQNRPPWHKTRPRPPITAGGGRRPIPQYKPMPPMPELHLDEGGQFTTSDSHDTDPSSDESNESAELENRIPTTTTTEETTPPKKDELFKKKVNKTKSGERKPPPPPPSENELTTIIQSTSVVNTAQVVTQTLLQSSTSSSSSEEEEYDPATEDILFITTSSTRKTPDLDSGSDSNVSTSSSTIDVVPSRTTTTSAIAATPTTQQPQQAVPTNLPYHPRPGIVLDDPEFKPGGHGPRPQRPAYPAQQIQPTRQHLPPGYGEIFDVTLSAIQGPGSGTSKQTINIKPYGSYGTPTEPGGGVGSGDIIISPSGEDGFVSIDGKRTYINLFGEETDAQRTTTVSTASYLPNNGSQKPPIGTGYAIAETEIEAIQPSKSIAHRTHAPPTMQHQSPPQRPPHYRPRTTQPPVRIDTCVVGEDSICDQHERCRTENGVSSCHCRPGYSRRKHREPCRRVVSFFLGLRVDKIYEHKIVWDSKLLDKNSDPYAQLSYESIRAIDSAMSMTPFSDEFMEARVNNIYNGDATQGQAGVFVNLTLRMEENAETLRPSLRSDIQKHLLGVLHRRNNNIGNSVLYVDTPAGSISSLQDLDECQSRDLNDCHSEAVCTNFWGSFRCECRKGFRDPWPDQIQRSGRECQTCPDTYCNNRGTCSFADDGQQVCECDGSHYGSQCEIDGEVLGVAIGASVAAVIIIVLTLICLIMWSRRWQREQKNAMGSPVFGYMNTVPVKAAGMGQPGYQVTLEDRMRWAQIADVMSQSNHYGAEPVGPTRPSSAMFGYPNLQAMGMGMGTIGGISMTATLPMHSNSALPPVPLPSRFGHRNGMRTLENSSSSEEEDRTDLLGRNFQVPRPKSRSNGSIANQSGIYYDVDYEPSGIENATMYGQPNQTQQHHMPGPQGIPMSTYTSGRAPSTYYMK